MNREQRRNEHVLHNDDSTFEVAAKARASALVCFEASSNNSSAEHDNNKHKLVFLRQMRESVGESSILILLDIAASLLIASTH